MPFLSAADVILDSDIERTMVPNQADIVPDDDVVVDEAQVAPSAMAAPAMEPVVQAPVAPAAPQAAPYHKEISAVSKHFGVNPDLIHKIVKAESGYDPAAKSKKGAKGLMQLMPVTAKEMGVEDATHPMQNLVGGARYLSNMKKLFGNDDALALAAYNWGPSNVRRLISAGRGRIPAETVEYVDKVLGGNKALIKSLNQLKRQRSPKA